MTNSTTTHIVKRIYGSGWDSKAYDCYDNSNVWVIVRLYNNKKSALIRAYEENIITLLNDESKTYCDCEEDNDNNEEGEEECDNNEGEEEYDSRLERDLNIWPKITNESDEEILKLYDSSVEAIKMNSHDEKYEWHYCKVVSYKTYD